MQTDGLTSAQRNSFIAAWLGWAFDGIDGFLYSLIALPFVTELMAGHLETEVKQKAALIQAVFLFGWAVGGAVFGRIGDRIGRSKTLILTILTYAIFTGASFIAQNWWELMIFRFLTALGIGGEWAAGSALVSEMLSSRHRAWASATLQSGFQVGMITAALCIGALSGFTAEHGHRYVFLIGILPALLTLWIRRSVPESPEWSKARQAQKVPSILELFAPSIRRTTLIVLTLTSVSLTTIWAFFYFVQQLVQKHPELSHLPKTEISRVVMSVTVGYGIWNIVANYAGAYLARVTSYRVFFLSFFGAALICFLFGFSQEKPLSETIFWIDAGCFFASGVFAVFPLYIPPLFPTLLRTTGAGFCYNFGRVIAALGTLAGGAIWGKSQPREVIHAVGYLFVLGCVAALFAPELPVNEAVTQ